MSLDGDLWLHSPGLTESLRIFRRVTLTARAQTRRYGLSIGLLRAVTERKWRVYHEQESGRSTIFLQAASYTLLALHELYRQEYVPFARSGRVGGLAHLEEGLKPLDELKRLLPRLGELESCFTGMFLAYRLDWLTRPRHFGMWPTGWESKYESERRECVRSSSSHCARR